MADIFFTCPRCTQRLVIDEAGAGLVVTCPTCTHLLMVPQLNRAEDLKRTQKMAPDENPARTPGQPSELRRKAA